MAERNDQTDDSALRGMTFKPTPDITADELARTLQKVAALTKMVSQKQVSEWPRELQRHWRLFI